MGVYDQTPLIELQILHPDGKTVDVEMKGEKINYEGRMAMETIIRDISQRKQIESELAKTQHELNKKIKEQLSESYLYLSLVNRKIALLLEVESHTHGKNSKQEILDYILNSAVSISRAKIGLLYIGSDSNDFNLISISGLDKAKYGNLKQIDKSDASFIGTLVKEKKRVSGSCSLVDSGCFRDSIDISYFVALPILSHSRCNGFLFLGFTDLKSMDSDELQFLDVYSRHVSSALSNAGIL